MNYVSNQPTGQPPQNPDFNWQPMPNQISFQEYQAGLQRPHSLLEFFHKHPHFINVFAHKMEELVVGVVARKMSPMAKFAQVALSIWRQQFHGDQQMTSSIDTVSAELQSLVNAGNIPQMSDGQGGQRPQMVADTLDLSSEAFLQALTDEDMNSLQAMHESNHQYSINQGMGHFDPGQQAFHTDYGMTDPNGQFVPHHQPNYGQPGYPQQPYPAAPQGYGGQTLTGTLLGLGMGYLAGGQQQQQQQQRPPPQYY